MWVSNVDKLIYPVSEGHATIKYYVTNDELFDIIHAAHIRIGHGGRNRMIKETQLKYKNVTTEPSYASVCIVSNIVYAYVNTQTGWHNNFIQSL